MIAFADRYAEALPDGEGLKDAMRHGAKDFLNALRMLRMLHLALWASNVYHNTSGALTSTCGRTSRPIWTGA